MQLKSYKVRVECGEYAGKGTNGAWTSSTDRQFYTVINAQTPQLALTIAEQQYGGPTRCRVSYVSET